MLHYCEMLPWDSPDTLSPKYAIQTGIPFGGNQKRKVATDKKNQVSWSFSSLLIIKSNFVLLAHKLEERSLERKHCKQMPNVLVTGKKPSTKPRVSLVPISLLELNF